MAAWLARDDFDGSAQAVPEFRALPTQVGVSGADLWSYGYGGDAGGQVRLVLDGAGSVALDPETYASQMLFSVWVPSAPAGPVEVSLKLRMEPYRYGYSPLADNVEAFLGGELVEVKLWRFNGVSWFHQGYNAVGGWQPGVPAATGPVVDEGGNATITIRFLNGFVTVDDGSIVATIPTGASVYDGVGEGFGIKFTLMNVEAVDYIQLSGVGASAPEFWTNFVNTYEVP